MDALAPVRRFVWRYPDWWIVIACCLAWLLVIARPHPLMLYDRVMVVPMVVAMMLPVTLPVLRHVAFSSLWSRRHRAMALFAFAYLLVWLAAELGIVLILALLDRSIGIVVTRIAAVAVAVLWETSRRKALMLRRCARTIPLAPRGWRADTDCARFGILIGVNCVGSCWATMAVCTALAGYPLVMVAAFFVQIGGFTYGAYGPIVRIRYDTTRRLLLSSLRRRRQAPRRARKVGVVTLSQTH